MRKDRVFAWLADWLCFQQQLCHGSQGEVSTTNFSKLTRKDIPTEQKCHCFSRSKCANPFHQHASERSSLLYSIKAATEEERDICNSNGAEISDDASLCAKCRLHLKKLPRRSGLNQDVTVRNDSAACLEGTGYEEDDMDISDDIPVENEESGPMDLAEPNYMDRDTVYEDLARLSSAIGLPLSSKTDIRVEEVAMNNSRGIKEKVREMLQLVSGRQIMEGGSECQLCVEQVISSSSKYDTLTKRSEKYLLLTSVPSWVTITKMMEVFGIGKRMAERASNMRNTLGPFSQPPPKAGHPIPLTTIALVQQFYYSLDNSRPSPNLRDVRKGKAKHYLLFNQKDLFREFKLKYPEHKLSVSKFIQLAPQECVWPSKNGFRTTCLCVIHENFELLLGAVDIGGRTSEVLCNKPEQVGNFYCSDSPECLLGLCSDCPKWQKLTQALSDYEAEDIDYQQWVSAGQGEGVKLATFACPKDQFEQLFGDQNEKTAEHHLIYLKQKLHISSLKSFSGSSDKSHAVILCDFGMNYSFQIQFRVTTGRPNRPPFTLLCYTTIMM